MKEKDNRPTMNKSAFIRVYADKLGVTLKEAEANLMAFKDALTDVLPHYKHIHISKFYKLLLP